MIDYSALAPLNATLNALAGVLLMTGFVFIRRKQWRAHRACMLTAFAVSVFFLASYLAYHYHVGDVRFTGTGWVRPVYFTILITHIVLAVTIVPLAIITLSRGLGGRFRAHRKIARWTWPLWMYVSVTGVIVYLMCYKLYTPLMPPAASASNRAAVTVISDRDR